MIFPGEPGSAGSSPGLPAPSLLEQNLRGLVEWGILWAGCPSCYAAVSVKALEGTQSINPN